MFNDRAIDTSATLNSANQRRRKRKQVNYCESSNSDTSEPPSKRRGPIKTSAEGPLFSIVYTAAFKVEDHGPDTAFESASSVKSVKDDPEHKSSWSIANGRLLVILVLPKDTVVVDDVGRSRNPTLDPWREAQYISPYWEEGEDIKYELKDWILASEPFSHQSGTSWKHEEHYHQPTKVEEKPELLDEIKYIPQTKPRKRKALAEITMAPTVSHFLRYTLTELTVL